MTFGPVEDAEWKGQTQSRHRPVEDAEWKGQTLTPSIAFRHLPPRKEGCRKPVLEFGADSESEPAQASGRCCVRSGRGRPRAEWKGQTESGVEGADSERSGRGRLNGESGVEGADSADLSQANTGRVPLPGLSEH